MEIIPFKPGRQLSLTNSGNLEIFFIGVGTAFANANSQTNFLIIKGDAHLLVDFGQKGQAALEATAGLSPSDIGAVLPTHSHADHVGGLETLALLNRYVAKPQHNKSTLRMIITQKYQRVLWDYTLRGGLEYNEEFARGNTMCFSDYFEALRPTLATSHPREVFTFNYQGITLELFRTRHIPETAKNWETSFISYGLFIDGRVFYSGDTQYDPELITLYQDRADIMFHDVQFYPGGVHAYIDELRDLPAATKRKMHLLHYADNYREQKIEEFAGWTLPGCRYIFR